MADFLTALRFLTIVPLGRGEQVPPERMAASMSYFPLIGAWIGAALWLLDAGLGKFLPMPVATALTIAFLALITGGLHLDGFADTLDGLFGGKGDRERALEIMKDSRIGAIGVVGLAMLLILKFAALGSLYAPMRTQALIVMPMLARWSQVLAAFGADYARKDGGTGEAFVEHIELRHFLAATIGAAVIALLISGPRGLAAIAVIGAVTLGARLYFTRKLGGVTGDTIGAVSELNEVLVLLIFIV